ncbi:MAG: tRNA guanosine(34) transglycosylase Tgt [Candidatus Shapirobacteria bacterium]
MTRPKVFKTITGKKIPLPVFFPDATRAVIRTLDSVDIKKTQTPGILVNTYHLFKDLGKKVIQEHGGIRPFMHWNGGVISDSGGFQIMTLAKKSGQNGKITDKGVTFKPTGGKKIFFTPQDSIEFQLALKSDMIVVLDDFTPPKASRGQAIDSVTRTLLWAEKSKQVFEEGCRRLGLSGAKKPYLLGVVQGDNHLDLRAQCTQELVKIGFDGLGYGGWPIGDNHQFYYDVAQVIADNSPANYFLYGLGVGKPEEIVGCFQLGFTIFDCVLPTRDARHQRLYVYKTDSINQIDPFQPNFYSYFVPTKEKHYHDTRPVSTACDCLLCTHYTRAYLAHLFRTKEMTAGRLATIHNLRFYSILMSKLRP